MIGDKCTGKTSLLNFNDKRFSDEYIPTFAVDIRIKIFKHNDKNIRFHLWDTSSDPRFYDDNKAYFRGAQGFFIFFSVIDRNSFEKVEFWKSYTYRLAYREVQCILIGNKSDLENERVVSYEEGKEIADYLGIPYLEMSIKHGFNVEKAFQLLRLNIIHNILYPFQYLFELILLIFIISVSNRWLFYKKFSIKL